MFPPAKKELHELLSKPTLGGIPLLVLFNKNDLETAVKPDLIAQALYVRRGCAVLVLMQSCTRTPVCAVHSAVL